MDNADVMDLVQQWRDILSSMTVSVHDDQLVLNAGSASGEVHLGPESLVLWHLGDRYGFRELVRAFSSNGQNRESRLRDAVKQCNATRGEDWLVLSDIGVHRALPEAGAMPSSVSFRTVDDAGRVRRMHLTCEHDGSWRMGISLMVQGVRVLNTELPAQPTRDLVVAALEWLNEETSLDEMMSSI